MGNQDYEIIPSDGLPINKSGIKDVLAGIRPVWQGKNLIQRVERLLPVDPSSACQRLFNAAVHDLKDKIIVMGVDLAREIAKNNGLPSVSKADDVLDYNVSKTIDLAYHMGLLSRPEWSRIHRCYNIRKDLEHEDDEYEAVLQDCFYIFKTVIDVVLSKDPIELLQVIEARALVESPNNITISEEFLNDYRNAPKKRKQEINELLISFAYDESKPDIIRENSVELMRTLAPMTDNTVKIELAKNIETKIGRNTIDTKTAKIAYACGSLAYFKKAKMNDFYKAIIIELTETGSDWGIQGKVCQRLEDVGGLISCPRDIYSRLIFQLVRIYLGEPSYGPNSYSRPVFFSNSAAPIICRLIKADSERSFAELELLRTNKHIASIIEYKPIARRFENLIDLADTINTEDEE